MYSSKSQSRRRSRKQRATRAREEAWSNRSDRPCRAIQSRGSRCIAVVSGPRFIESERLATFNPRGSDVAVVLDLMIHDIDLVLTLVGDTAEDDNRRRSAGA